MVAIDLCFSTLSKKKKKKIFQWEQWSVSMFLAWTESRKIIWKLTVFFFKNGYFSTKKCMWVRNLIHKMMLFLFSIFSLNNTCFLTFVLFCDYFMLGQWQRLLGRYLTCKLYLCLVLKYNKIYQMLAWKLMKQMKPFIK